MQQLRSQDIWKRLRQTDWVIVCAATALLGFIFINALAPTDHDPDDALGGGYGDMYAVPPGDQFS